MRRVLSFCSQWEGVVLLALVPALLFPTGRRSLLLLLLPLFFLLRRLGQGRFFPATPFDLAFLGLLFMVLVSLYATFDIELSFPKIAGMVLGVTLFYGAVAHVQDHRTGLWQVVVVVLAAGAGMALVGLLGVQWGGPFAPLNRLKEGLPAAWRAIPGTGDGLINANELAGVMDWILPLALALWAGLLPRLRRPLIWLWPWLGLGLLATLAAGLMLAGLARGGLLAAGAALLIMLAIRWRWGRWLAVFTLVAGILAYRFLPWQQWLVEGPLASVGSDVSRLGLEGRLEIWSRALYGLQDFAFTGMSMNGFRVVVNILYPLFLISPESDIAHAHNQVLQAGLDLGIPGMVAYLAVWLVAAVLLWQSWRAAGNGPENAGLRSLIIGLSGALSAGWLFGVLDAIALGARPGFIWWLLLALVAGVHRRLHAGMATGPGAAAYKRVEDPVAGAGSKWE